MSNLKIQRKVYNVLINLT